MDGDCATLQSVRTPYSRLLPAFTPLAATALLSACLGAPVAPELSDNHYYSRLGRAIHYSPQGNWFELGNDVMDAHVGSFEVLTRLISRDKARLYIKAIPVPAGEIDLATVTARPDAAYSRNVFDAQGVYYIDDDYVDGEQVATVTRLDGARPDTYRAIDHEWATDGERMYHDGDRLDLDAQTFREVNSAFALDAERVYVSIGGRYRPLEADAQSLTPLGTAHARDAAQTHLLAYNEFGNRRAAVHSYPYDAARETPEALSWMYVRVGDRLYGNGVPLDGVDAASFTVIDRSYGTDGQRVYYEGRVLADADAATFVESPEGRYDARDARGPYRNGYRVAD